VLYEQVIQRMAKINDLNLSSNALNRPDKKTPPLDIPNHTGHRLEQVDTGSKGFDLDSAPKVPNDTAHRDKDKPAVTNVFQSNEKQKAEKEQAIDDYLRGLGNVVEPNPLEGVRGAGRQGDRYINGVLTEYKTLEPGATSNTIKHRVNDALRFKGQARNIIIDVRNTEISQEEALRGIYRAIGISRGKLDNLRVIGNDFDIEKSVQQKDGQE
jgi:Contact-dependent growth inhibition CdiA C-terminal domain